MGAWLRILEDVDEGWYKVSAFGQNGFVRKTDTATENTFLKLFFIDVGQGDACLIEAPGKRLLVDAGQYKRNTHSYLAKWKYKHLISSGKLVKFDAVFITHFDADHFAGLTSIIEDQRFEFDTIYHNGIARFSNKSSTRPAKYNKKIGRTDAFGKPRGTKSTELKTTFNSFDDIEELLREGGLMSSFRKLLEAVIKARDEGRLARFKRLTARTAMVPGFSNPDELLLEVLGPVPLSESGSVSYPWFKDASHTINGHSIVLRLTYGDCTFLLGGDLNIPSEEYLLEIWEPESFRVDVAKACHHGASEFTVPFLKAVNPRATVFSSGDNENYAHPRADALGCAGRYTRGNRPLVFSTEIARSYKSGKDIHFGLINCRADGKQIVMAQMFEKKKSGDMWDSYILP
jgi:beta-lactamase superfamily II metal-dependent hydrolase